MHLPLPAEPRCKAGPSAGRSGAASPGPGGCAAFAGPRGCSSAPRERALLQGAQPRRRLRGLRSHPRPPSGSGTPHPAVGSPAPGGTPMAMHGEGKARARVRGGGSGGASAALAAGVGPGPRRHLGGRDGGALCWERCAGQVDAQLHMVGFKVSPRLEISAFPSTARRRICPCQLTAGTADTTDQSGGLSGRSSAGDRCPPSPAGASRRRTAEAPLLPGGREREEWLQGSSNALRS